MFKYKLISDANDAEQGKYISTCVRCNYSLSGTFSKSSTRSVFQLFITNKTSPDRVLTCASFSESRPLSYNPSRNGYTFLGWSVDSESTTPDFLPEDSVFITNEALPLYAVWGSNITAVGGKNINTQSTSDVFGDGSVIYTPQTARDKAVLTLNNAHIVAYPVVGVSEETGIYTNTDIEIMLVGDNIIETENANAIGILSDGSITFSGDGSLAVRAAGSGYYATGVKAKNVDVYSKNIYITDCKTGFYGAAALYDGTTEIYARNYKGSGFKTFTQPFAEDPDEPMCVIGTSNVNNSASKLSGASAAMNANYVLIAPENKPLIHYNADRKTIIPVCNKNGTLIFANYDETGKTKNIKTITQNFANKETTVTELSIGDKIFFWESFDTLKPLCEAFTVK